MRRNRSAQFEVSIESNRKSSPFRSVMRFHASVGRNGSSHNEAMLTAKAVRNAIVFIRQKGWNQQVKSKGMMRH